MRTRWIAALFTAGLVLGQPRVQITAVDRVPTYAGDPIPQIIARLPQLTLGPLTDGAAKSMLDAASTGSEIFLRWKLDNLVGATTLTDREIDILVAHWATTGTTTMRTDAWLWDNPTDSIFLLPFALDDLNDRTRLGKFFESLWVWWEPDPKPEPPDPSQPDKPRTPARIRVSDPRTKAFDLKMAPPISEGLFGRGIAAGEPLCQVPLLGCVRGYVGLYRRGNRVWIAIDIGKRWITTPSGMFEIAERFPLLRERVREWSMNRLLYEYGRPLISGPSEWTTERDTVILTELLRRDLSAGQLRQLLGRAQSSGNIAAEKLRRDRESGMMIQLVVSAGKSRQFEDLMREEIIRAKQKPMDEALGNMLHSLLRATEVDVSDLAVECIGVHWYASFHAFHYLETRAHTVSIYKSLRALAVPNDLLADKERTLAAIQKRLH